MKDKLLLIGLVLFPFILYGIGDFLSCYYMISGSNTWCDRFV